MKPEPNASSSPANALSSDKPASRTKPCVCRAAYMGNCDPQTCEHTDGPQYVAKPASVADKFVPLIDIIEGEWPRRKSLADDFERLLSAWRDARSPENILAAAHEFARKMNPHRAHILSALREYERKDAIRGAIEALYEKYRFESCQEANDTAQNVIDDVLAAFDRQANHAK